MPNIQTAEFIKGLLRKAGVEITDEINTALSAKDISQLPDTITNSISSGLLSITEAANHPTVRLKATGEKLGGLDNAVWKFIKGSGISREDYAKVRGAYDPDKNKFSGSIADTITGVLSFVSEVSEKRGEQKGGLDPKELRAQLEAEFQSKYDGKLAANETTIGDYETRFQAQQKTIETLQRTMDDKEEQMYVDFFLKQQQLQYIPKLKPEYVDHAKMFQEAKTRELNETYVVRKDPEDGEYKLWNKTDPTARALDADNKMINLQEFIGKQWAPLINPNAPVKPGGGNGGPILPNGNGQGQGTKKPAFGAW